MSSNDRPVGAGYSETIPRTKGARNVDRKIVPFPTLTTNAEDPAVARALIYGEIEVRELVHNIPQASPVAPKTLY